MATKTYGTNVIPNDVVNVLAGSTVDISLAFNATVGYVGNMDVANGTANTGEVYHVPDSTTAADLFGEGSELYRQTQLAYSNGVADVYAVAVNETSVSAETIGGGSGTLANTPVIAPSVCEEHAITAVDNVDGYDLTVNETYESPPSVPDDVDTVNINPTTGEAERGDSSDFDVTYDYADYSGPITSIVDENVRYVSALTESESVGNSLLSELNSHGTNFDFKRGNINGEPDIKSNYSAVTDYSHGIDDQRMSVTVAARGYIDDAETEEVRLCGLVAAKAAGKQLGDTMTNEPLSGLTGLRTEYTAQEAADLIDARVLPVMPDDRIEVVKDMTTSSVAKFSRIYACDIVDEISEISHQISKQYIGEMNFEENQESLADDHVSALAEMASDRPPLLASVDGSKPYVVNVDSVDANSIDLEVGADIVGVIDSITVDIVIGDVVTNGGAS